MPFDSLETRIESVERRFRFVNAVLPTSLATGLVDIEWAETQRQRRERTTASFNTRMEDLRRLGEQLEADATALETRSVGASGPETEKISVRLDQATTQVETVEQLDTDYLYVTEIEEFDEIKEIINRVDSWLTAYRKVGKHVDTAEARFADLEEELEPYRGYEMYLTSTERDRFSELLETAETAITDGFDAARTTPLANAYVDRLSDLRADLEQYRDFVTTYNETYISLETERNEDLFTDIDDAGHNLTAEQKSAVIHDDKYNLVAAGAGSGKTMTLARRVGYMTQRTDSVPPDRILAISYTNPATEVMRSRLESQFGIRDVETTTFHALGKQIIETEWSTEPEVFLPSDRRDFISRYIDDEIDSEESAFTERYVQFLHHFYDDMSTSATFEEKEATVQLEVQNARMTLKQEAVRSASEKTIADFLFLNQVEYEYRSLQEWVEEATGRGTYRADFYLPKYEVVLSHRPIAADGSQPDWSPYSSLDDLLSEVQWERRRIGGSDRRRLVETYEFEADTGRLERALRARLVDAGVVLDEMNYETLVNSAFNYTEVKSEIDDLFSSFINNARQLDLSPDEVADRVADSPPKAFAFGQCAEMLYRAYCNQLDNNQYVDYPGMLHQAIEAIRANPSKYETMYDQVLIDEFQDVSKSKVDLVKQFVTPDNDTKLFCVGDDWQSIYSFSGSDVTYFIDFEEYFDTPQRSELTSNYRCPETVVEASNELIRNNDRQLEKSARPVSDTDTEIKVHPLPASPHEQRYDRVLCEHTTNLIEAYLADGASPDDILVLCRTNSYYPYLESVCSDRGIQTTRSQGQEANASEHVQLYSVHKSKGEEADHVIILHAVEDLLGFPSKVEDEELLEPVRLAPEDNIAEERRLFYVALTRSAGTLDVLTSEGQESQFLGEIDSYLTRVSTLATLSEDERFVDLDRVWVSHTFDAADSQIQSGVLADGFGKSRFVIWEDSSVEPLSEGTVYRIRNARVTSDDYSEVHEYEMHLGGRVTVEALGPHED